MGVRSRVCGSQVLEKKKKKQTNKQTKTNKHVVSFFLYGMKN